MYRHEFKYGLDVYQLEILKQTLPAIMELDSNVGARGQYQIRSLYFDDYYNRCFYENENGVDPELQRITVENPAGTEKATKRQDPQGVLCADRRTDQASYGRRVSSLG